jgi:hypothetical protein
VVSDTWPVEKRKGTAARPIWTRNWWGETLSFRAEVVHGKGSWPAAVKASFTVQPKLESLEVEPSGTQVLFTGKAHAVPTTAGLAILCERMTETGWERVAAVPDRLHFARRFTQGGLASRTLGSLNEDMSFGADVPADLFEPGTYRFIWYVAEFADHLEAHLSRETHELSVPQLNNLKIAAVTTRSFTSEELRGGSKTPVEVPSIR